MRELPDKSVDLVLTDPPYGIGEARGKNKTRGCLAISRDYGVSDWDDAIPSKEVFDEMLRVSKNQVIFGGNYFIEYLYNSPCWIVWDKDNGNTDFADCELAWTSFKTAVRKYKYKWQGMLQEDMKNKEFRYHPTQKPIGLFEWILDKYSEPGMTILDPFLGSGTTAVAALNTGRLFIGIEKEPKYCEIARQRVKAAQAQQSLFGTM
jgi:site-specific DNA-methyltransferase (adenine-specific)